MTFVQTLFEIVLKSFVNFQFDYEPKHYGYSKDVIFKRWLYIIL